MTEQSSAVAASQCLGPVVQIRRAGLRRGRRGRAQISRSFALGPAALVALLFGGHIHIAPFAALQHFAAEQHFQAGAGSAHLLLIGRAATVSRLLSAQSPLDRLVSSNLPLVMAYRSASAVLADPTRR